MSSDVRFTDFKSDKQPTWCPGCGDFGTMNGMMKALAETGNTPDDTFVVAGIGCSGKIGTYMHSYALHGVHGRALPVGTGVKLANPDLEVMVAGGDGDGYSIGAGHFVHAVRRNVDMTYVVMDNRIYGLTKGQASPTCREDFETARRRTAPNNRRSTRWPSRWRRAARSSPSRSPRTHSATRKSFRRPSNTTASASSTSSPRVSRSTTWTPTTTSATPSSTSRTRTTTPRTTTRPRTTSSTPTRSTWRPLPGRGQRPVQRAPRHRGQHVRDSRRRTRGRDGPRARVLLNHGPVLDGSVSFIFVRVDSDRSLGLPR